MGCTFTGSIPFSSRKSDSEAIFDGRINSKALDSQSILGLASVFYRMERSKNNGCGNKDINETFAL
jgi:hypothetical protein